MPARVRSRSQQEAVEEGRHVKLPLDRDLPDVGLDRGGCTYGDGPGGDGTADDSQGSAHGCTVVGFQSVEVFDAGEGAPPRR